MDLLGEVIVFPSIGMKLYYAMTISDFMLFQPREMPFLADSANIEKLMDAKDRQIITALQRDGRLTIQDLSEQVNLSPSPCLRRVRMLEEAGVITGYTAVVNEQAYGLPITALVHIRLERHTEAVVKAFEREIGVIDEIVDCYVMTGAADYLLRVLVSSLQDYERFVRTKLHLIKGIAGIETSFAYGVIKRSMVFPPVG